MTFEIAFVLLALVGMVIALVLDKMRPGMILFSVVVLFLCAGILTPKEMLEGFSNKGMITVAMLFLVSEGIRQSGALGQLIKRLLPQGKTTVFKAQLRMLPTISFISAFLNNTPVVVIFAPIIKRWAESVKLPATKFLIPLSYVTILGGICTLIGTSTNLVVHGMILESGHEGFTMFELGKVGIFIAVAGIIYLLLFSSKLLPDTRKDAVKDEEEAEEHNSDLHTVEVVLGARFPGINKKLKDFNFKRHYGAEVIRTLTGFKWIGGAVGRLEQEGGADRFVYGFEESCGYMIGSYVRDKDGIGAAMILCELADACKAEGKTLWDYLEDLYQTYGRYETGLKTYQFSGEEASLRMKRIREGLKSPEGMKFAGSKVVRYKDYLDGADGIPASDVLALWMEDGSQAQIRPSGTEPKIKVYTERVTG